jgi:hypothetical protein
MKKSWKKFCVLMKLEYAGKMSGYLKGLEIVKN